jgi:hypothetical protein
MAEVSKRKGLALGLMAGIGFAVFVGAVSVPVFEAAGSFGLSSLTVGSSVVLFAILTRLTRRMKQARKPEAAKTA